MGSTSVRCELRVGLSISWWANLKLVSPKESNFSCPISGELPSSGLMFQWETKGFLRVAFWFDDELGAEVV